MRALEHWLSLFCKRKLKSRDVSVTTVRGSVSVVARMQMGGSARPGAPGKEMVGSRPGFRSSFILCRTL